MADLVNLVAGASGCTAATIVAAEGARVGIVTCRECGAALLLDPREERDVVSLHRSWHGALTDEQRKSI